MLREEEGERSFPLKGRPRIAGVSRNGFLLSRIARNLFLGSGAREFIIQRDEFIVYCGGGIRFARFL